MCSCTSEFTELAVAIFSSNLTVLNPKEQAYLVKLF